MMRCGTKPMRKVSDLLGLLRERVREPEHETELGHLGGLNVDRAEREPARGAAAGVTEARRTHEQEQHGDHREDRVGEPAVAVVVDVAREPHEDERDHGVERPAASGRTAGP